MPRFFRSYRWLVQLSFVVWLIMLWPALAQPPEPLSLFSSYLKELKATKPNPEILRNITTEDFKLLVQNDDAEGAISNFRRAGEIEEASIANTERFFDFVAYLIQVKCKYGQFVWQFRLDSASQKIVLANLLDQYTVPADARNDGLVAPSGMRDSSKRPASKKASKKAKANINIAKSTPPNPHRFVPRFERYAMRQRPIKIRA